MSHSPVHRESPTALNRYQKICPPGQYLSIFKRATNRKVKLLKQLEQLGIDTQNLQNEDLKTIQAKFEKTLRTSYSFKYIGMRDNQIGILSKRVRPNEFSTDMLPKTDGTHVVTSFFYPKPLKTVCTSSQKALTVQNLQSEIKRSFPKHESKELFRSTKVCGSWRNMFYTRRRPSHLKNAKEDFEPPRIHYRSYSRLLQSREFQQLTNTMTQS